MTSYEQEYIEFRVFVIGCEGVGKTSFINRMMKMPCTQNLSNSNTSKSKLYNILKFKLAFKFAEIPPAESLPLNFNVIDDEDSDYEIEKEYRISFDKTKKEMTKFLQSQDICLPLAGLNDYKISVENIFIFLTDLTNFNSFKSMIIYYQSINKRFKDSGADITGVVIANKADKRVVYNQTEQTIVDNFLNDNQLNYFEVSTRPYFRFEKFFEEMFYSMFGMFREQFKSKEFKEKLNIVLSLYPTFSKSERKFLERNDVLPGPGLYDVDVYNCNNEKEIKLGLINKKTRFKKKIFVNKTGPIFVRPREDLGAKKEDNEHKLNFNRSMKDCVERMPKGYTMGIVSGRLHLHDERKALKKEMNRELQGSFEEDISGLLCEQKKLARDESYFKSALERKMQIHDELVKEKRERYMKLMNIHNKNLEKQKIIKENSAKNIFENQRLKFSQSSPNILTNLSSEEEKNQNQKKKERYYNVIFGNNKKHLQKQDFTKKMAYANFITPGPSSYDIRGNMLDPKKGFTIQGKRSTVKIKEEPSPPFTVLKSDFDIIAEHQNNSRRVFVERFKPLKKEPNTHVEDKYNKKWKQWDLNRQKSERNLNVKYFLEERGLRKIEQVEMLKKIKREKEIERENIRQELIDKGYDDGSIVKEINYSLVEERAPSYTIKGRDSLKKPEDRKEYNILGQNDDIDYINDRLSSTANPLPNFNYPKPNLPAYSFEKAARFPKIKVNQEGSFDLFQNGKFALDDHEDFSSVEPFSLLDRRGVYVKREDYPGPGEYRIKSFAEEISEKEKK